MTVDVLLSSPSGYDSELMQWARHDRRWPAMTSMVDACRVDVAAATAAVAVGVSCVVSLVLASVTAA